ncbi:MAG: dihydroneopterin aldolase [Candidatus Cryptobacteroides sp.]
MSEFYNKLKNRMSDVAGMDFALIELEGMEFHAYHGCLESERKEGNLFVVDFSGYADIHKASRSDSLSDTVDYGKVYEVVAEEMAVPSNLLEAVATRIADRIRSEFPEFAEFKIRVSKKNPPVAGKVQWSRITVDRQI